MLSSHDYSYLVTPLRISYFNMSRLFLATLCSVFLSLATISYAQLGTQFWFAAPEVTSADGDRPILLRFATLSQAAQVTVSEPANPPFATQTLNIPANSQGSIDITPQIAFVENVNPNIVLPFVCV